MATYIWLLLLALCHGESVFRSCVARVAVDNVKSLDEIEEHLRQLNKPAVKSIKSPDGDIIDCVLLQHQPAFNHPAFQSSNIQQAPTSRPKRSSGEKQQSLEQRSFQLWQQNGKCPTGTFPLRRTTKHDILRFGGIPKKFGQKPESSALLHRNTSSSIPGAFGFSSSHEHAIAYVEGDEYFGAKASINVWSPPVEGNAEFSLSQVWILGGTFDGTIGNSIEAGWQVFPGMYGDQNPRLFIYWTSDSYQATGCYNLLCSGFVQTSNEIVIGGTISPSSTAEGSQYDISILIWKDPEEGNWWLEYGDKLVGYWPAYLFTELAFSANIVEWGGEVVNSRSQGKHTSTMMGSGMYAEAGFGRASYFRDLEIVNHLNSLQPPQDLETYAVHRNCYDIAQGVDKVWGSFFYYGGPGSNPTCP